MSVALVPNAEQAFIGWATSQSELTALIGGRAGTSLNGTMPALRVTRVGSASLDVWQDNASLQVDCWADDQAGADQLVRTLVATLPRIRNLALTGGRVYTYEITSGPFWSPDDPALSSLARYIVVIDLLITL